MLLVMSHVHINFQINEIRRIKCNLCMNQGLIKEEGMQQSTSKLCGRRNVTVIVISKNRFLLNRVLCKVQVADSYK